MCSNSLRIRLISLFVSLGLLLSGWFPAVAAVSGAGSAAVALDAPPPCWRTLRPSPPATVTLVR